MDFIRKPTKQVFIKRPLIFAIFMVSLLYGIKAESNTKTYKINELSKDDEFLINNKYCKIPNLNPFSKEAMSVYQAIPYKKCHKLDPLTSVVDGKLIIHENLKKNYLTWLQNDIKCCYKRISRSGFDATADNVYSLSSCRNFKSGHRLAKADEFILVKCVESPKNKSIVGSEIEVYVDAHARIVPKKKSEVKSKESPVNVLLIGIDTISRLNLIRSMPKVFEYLKKNDWYDMKVFSKIAYNTFPNLMAILTGVHEDVVDKKCNWKFVGGLEKCQFLWNDFSNAGYKTAYAEDTMGLTTFNYYKTGFVKPPTDHYFRPFAMAAEDHLPLSYEKAWLSKCIGYRHYADYIYQYGVDFAKEYQKDSFFGLFWTNSFSQTDISSPSEYDDRMLHYLKQLQNQGTLNNTIVMFFSDHGMRFGKIRNLFTGWLEERMPYLFFWIPETFKKQHTKLVDNLKINENRLVTPFDIHVTMKHILKLYGKFDGDLKAESCEKCQSLFTEIPFERSCEDAGIKNGWCPCSSFEEIDLKSGIVKKAANFVVATLNSNLSPFPNCAKLQLGRISTARMTKKENATEYLVSFNVLPSKGSMEAIVKCSNEDCEMMEIVGEILRINDYGLESWCISDSIQRRYCYCV